MSFERCPFNLLNYNDFSLNISQISHKSFLLQGWVNIVYTI